MAVRGWNGLKSYGPAGLFAMGLALIVAAVLAGEAEVSLVVVFPVISGSGPLILGGAAMMVLGFLSGFVALASGGLRPRDDVAVDAPGDDREGGANPRKTYGGVIMIGPIPISFGSDLRIAIIMMAVGIAIAVLVVVALLI